LLVNKNQKLMALKFALFGNHLTSDPNDYMAVVQDLKNKTQEDVFNLMISRGSTVTRAEALSVFEEYGNAIGQLVKDGCSVNTRYLTCQVGCRKL
jgi:hypothetical protein